MASDPSQEEREAFSAAIDPASMHPEISKWIGKTIPAVAERADFGPAYNGEDYVTMTFRIQKDIPAIVGTWELTPRGPGTFPWAVQKNPDED